MAHLRSRLPDVAAVLTLLFVGTTALLHAGEMEQALFEGLQAARRAAGVGELRHRRDLDDAARSQAAAIARRPHGKRLQFDEPVEVLLQRSGIDDVRRAVLHVDLKRGYSHPEAAVLEAWKAYGAAWRNAMSAALDSAGVAFHSCDDDWIVAVVILVEELDASVFEAADLRALERETVQALNEVRRGRGLGELRFDPGLAEVARSHSVDMAQKGYFAHQAPDGRDAAARVRDAGLSFDRLGENLHKSRGVENPVQTSVDAWMQSRRHRETLLDPDYRRTAVGIAVDEAGTLHFTQLFTSSAD